MNLHKFKHRAFFYLFFISACFVLCLIFDREWPATAGSCLYVLAGMFNCEGGYLLGRSYKVKMSRSWYASQIIPILDTMDKDDRFSDSERWNIIRSSFKEMIE